MMVVGTYNWQIKAITANPYSAEYRRIYSQTNLVLATGIIGNKEITDEQKQKVGVLIQQSAREGKAAIALDTANAKYWTNLAAIYRQLIGSVDGRQTGVTLLHKGCPHHFAQPVKFTADCSILPQRASLTHFLSHGGDGEVDNGKDPVETGRFVQWMAKSATKSRNSRRFRPFSSVQRMDQPYCFV